MESRPVRFCSRANISLTSVLAGVANARSTGSKTLSRCDTSESHFVSARNLVLVTQPTNQLLYQPNDQLLYQLVSLQMHIQYHIDDSPIYEPNSYFFNDCSTREISNSKTNQQHDSLLLVHSSLICFKIFLCVLL